MDMKSAVNQAKSIITAAAADLSSQLDAAIGAANETNKQRIMLEAAIKDLTQTKQSLEVSVAKLQGEKDVLSVAVSSLRETLRNVRL